MFPATVIRVLSERCLSTPCSMNGGNMIISPSDMSSFILSLNAGLIPVNSSYMLGAGDGL